MTPSRSFTRCPDSAVEYPTEAAELLIILTPYRRSESVVSLGRLRALDRRKSYRRRAATKRPLS